MWKFNEFFSPVLGDVIMTPEEIMIQEVGSFLDQYGWILLLGAVVGITILVLIIVFIVINIKKIKKKRKNRKYIRS